MGHWIKKVRETPLQPLAKVINSLTGRSSVDAPSVKAVNEALDAKVVDNLQGESTNVAPSVRAVKTAVQGRSPKDHTHEVEDITDFPTFQTTTQTFNISRSVTSRLQIDNFNVDVTKNGWKPLGLLGAYIESDTRTVNLDWCYLSDLGAVGASVNGQCSLIDGDSRTVTVKIIVGYYKFE